MTALQSPEASASLSLPGSGDCENVWLSKSTPIISHIAPLSSAMEYPTAKQWGLNSCLFCSLRSPALEIEHFVIAHYASSESPAPSAGACRVNVKRPAALLRGW